MSYGARPLLLSHRIASDLCTVARSLKWSLSNSDSSFSASLRSVSTNSTCAAFRLKNSMPTLPVPAKRSAHLLPSMLEGPRIETSAERVLDVVGRNLRLDVWRLIFGRLNSVLLWWTTVLVNWHAHAWARR